MEPHTLILCGDARLDALYRLLCETGRPALRQLDTTDTAAIQAAATIVLPTPAVKNGRLLGDRAKAPWQRVFALFSPRQRLFGGGFSAEQTACFTGENIPFFDFLRDEGFTQYNARLTAQGALRLLLEATQDDLATQTAVITGFGRVANALAALLAGVGCRCVVATRSAAQRADAAGRGLQAIALPQLFEALGTADMVCNTVPAPLFSPGLLAQCKKGGVYLELASAPFGAQKEACLAAGLRYLDGGGLPGRFCPAAAAKAMLRRMDAGVLAAT